MVAPAHSVGTVVVVAAAASAKAKHSMNPLSHERKEDMSVQAPMSPYLCMISATALTYPLDPLAQSGCY